MAVRKNGNLQRLIEKSGAIEESGRRTTQRNWPTGAEIQSQEFWLYSPNLRQQLVL